MDKDIKKLWVSALNSGEYEQGYETLKTGNCYCCLGVLTDLHAKIEGIAMGTGGAYLSSAVMEWAGLNNHNPMIQSNLTLADLNDGGETDFKQIAKLIDESF